MRELDGHDPGSPPTLPLHGPRGLLGDRALGAAAEVVAASSPPAGSGRRPACLNVSLFQCFMFRVSWFTVQGFPVVWRARERIALMVRRAAARRQAALGAKRRRRPRG